MITLTYKTNYDDEYERKMKSVFGIFDESYAYRRNIYFITECIIN